MSLKSHHNNKSLAAILLVAKRLLKRHSRQTRLAGQTRLNALVNKVVLQPFRKAWRVFVIVSSKALKG